MFPQLGHFLSGFSKVMIVAQKILKMPLLFWYPTTFDTNTTDFCFLSQIGSITVPPGYLIGSGKCAITGEQGMTQLVLSTVPFYSTNDYFFSFMRDDRADYYVIEHSLIPDDFAVPI